MQSNGIALLPAHFEPLSQTFPKFAKAVDSTCEFSRLRRCAVQALEGPCAMLLEAAALVAAYITLHVAHSAAMHVDTMRMRAMRLPHWSRLWAFAQAFDCSRQTDLQKEKDIELAATLMQATSPGKPLGRCHREAIALLALPLGPSNPTRPCPNQTQPARAQTNRTPDEAFISDNIRPLTERAPDSTAPDLNEKVCGYRRNRQPTRSNCHAGIMMKQTQTTKPH